MLRPTIYADFHNADSLGRLRLNCEGTLLDLAEQRIILNEGLQLTLSDDELEVEGDIHFAEEEGLWVAVIDWNAIRQRSV
jgi:hypothetical protein